MRIRTIGAVALCLAVGAATGTGAQAKEPGKSAEKSAGPKYLSEIKRELESEEKAARRPAAKGGRLEAEEAGRRPIGTQIGFYELSPTMGSVSIYDKSAFTLGTNVSFRISEKNQWYFEPSVLASFLSADNNENTTVFHIDAGVRYDLAIDQSALVPFVKVAAGPSLSTKSNLTVNGNELSDSYLNLFAGGGLRVLISPSVGARLDTGVTFQTTDPGLYLAGAVAVPL